MSAAIAGNLHFDGGFSRGVEIAIEGGKRAQEAVEDGVIELRRHETGTVGGEANLLLVMPALGEFAGGIKPVERCAFTGPAYIEGCWGKGIERSCCGCTGTRSVS